MTDRLIAGPKARAPYADRRAAETADSRALSCRDLDALSHCIARRRDRARFLESRS